jgi:small subunit ribosomal protein S20
VAHSLSAKKRIRQNLTCRLRNRARKHVLKTLTRKFLTSVADGDAAQAEQQFRSCARMFDRVAAKGTIHKRTAAQHKSRLAAKLNGLKAKAAAKA